MDFDPQSAAEATVAPSFDPEAAATATLQEPPSDRQTKYTHAYEVYREHAHTLWGPGSDASVSRKLPFIGASQAYHDAQRIEQAKQSMAGGNPSDEDIYTLAQHQARQEYEGSQGLGGKLVEGLSGIPAMAVESLAAPGGKLTGGALKKGAQFVGQRLAGTPMMPSLWLKGAAERAEQQGGTPLEAQNLGPAAAMGTLQNLVIGSLGHVAGGIAKPATRFAARVGIGVGEQQGIEAMAGAVDEVLPEAYKTNTKYGLIGHILRGEKGEALQKAVVDGVTFAAFTALHGNPKAAKEHVEAVKKALDGAGSPEEAAAAAAHLNAQGPQPGLEAMPGAEAATPAPVAAEAKPEPAKPFSHLSPEEITQTASQLSPGSKIKTAEGLVEMLKKRGLNDLGVQRLSDATNPVSEEHGIGNRLAFDKAQEAEPKPAVAVTDVDKLGTMEEGQAGEVIAGKIDALKKAGLEPFHAGQDEFLVRGESPEDLKGKLEKARETLQSTHKADFSYGVGKTLGEADEGLHQSKALKREDSQHQRAVKEAMSEGADEAKANRERQATEEMTPQEHAELKSINESLHLTADVAARMRRRVEAALDSPTPERIGEVYKTIDRAEQRARAQGLNPEKVIHDRIPELKDFLQKLAAKPELLPHNQEVSDAINAAVAVAKNHGIDEASLRRGVANSLQGANEAVRTPPADKSSPSEATRTHAEGESAAGVPEASRHELRGQVPWVDEPAKPFTPLPKGDVTLYRYEHEAGEPKGMLATPERGQWFGLKEDKAYAGPGKRLLKVTLPSEAAERFRRGEDGFVLPKELVQHVREGRGYRDWLGVPEAASDKLRPGAVVPPERAEPVDQVEKFAKELAAEQTGTLNVTRTAEVAGMIYDKLKSAVQHVRDNLAELSGQMGPRTTRADQASGEALARFNAAPTFAREAAPYYIDKVMGKDATQADRRLAGAVITERRLRHMRDVFAQEGNADAAAAVKTIVGQPNSPLLSDAAYQQALASPKIQETLTRFKQEFVPVMDETFRKAQGMDDTDPINSHTQIPGEPVNLKAVREGDTPTESTVYTNGGRGNIKNVRLRKLPFAKEATGGADGYDIDLGAIIENSLSRGVSLAAKAEMVRTMVENGLAAWDKPGQQIKLNGAAAHEVPFTRPPEGTQANAPGKDALYIDDRAYSEVRQALKVDQPTNFPTIKAATDLLTKASLASTVEAAYHSKNMLTFLLKPGIRPADLIKNAYGVIAKTPEASARLVELARIGALKEGGFESGTYSKYNPLTWMGNFLDVMQRTMRLSGEDAFDRLHKQGLVQGSETNKRDFINQLGQYNRAAQNKVVVLLRDTGLGPFATAGTNYYMQGLKSLTMDPGVKATNQRAAVQLRAEMLGKTVAVLASAAVANYMAWGRIDGDDKTPLGAIKVGENKETGRTSYFDLTALIGLTRGARQTGLLALAEGERKGEKEQKTKDRAIENITSSLMHPGMGPPVQFAHTALTGKNSMGFNVADKPVKEDSHSWENFKAALRQANPVYSALSGAEQPKKQIPAEEKVMKLLGPYGVKYRYPVGHKYPLAAK